MLTIEKKSSPHFQPEIGDFLFATEFIDSYVKKDEDLMMFPLIFMPRYHPFVNMKRLNINIDLLLKQSKYDCPFTENSFIGLLPVAISTNDSKKYRKNTNFESSVYDYVFDLEWQKQMFSITQVSNIEQSFLGHGYTTSTLPTDGSNSLVVVKLKLSNDDFIIAKTWEWHNK